MRKLALVCETSVSKLVQLVNVYAVSYHIINVDVHCYHDMWYAFVLYEVIEGKGTV